MSGGRCDGGAPSMLGRGLGQLLCRLGAAGSRGVPDLQSTGNVPRTRRRCLVTFDVTSAANAPRTPRSRRTDGRGAPVRAGTAIAGLLDATHGSVVQDPLQSRP